MIKESANTLTIRTSTWQCDAPSNGMFDYDSSKLIKAEIKVKTNGVLVRMENGEVKFLPGTHATPSADATCVAVIDIQHGNFAIKSSREDYSDHKADALWLVVRNLTSPTGSRNGCRLNVGERIKIGKQEYKVLEIQTSPTKEKELLSKLYKKQELIKQEKENEATPAKTDLAFAPCKVCLADDINDWSNPLITPCQCSGSMKFIHLNCLRQWVRQRVNITSTQSVTAISWKTFSCELCKTPYPFAVYFDGKIHELIKMEVPKSPYMVLESIVRNSEESNGIFIIKFFPKTSISIGRNHEADWRVNDVSVSRYHAFLHWEFLNVYLEDCNSKFGTLKKPTGPLQVKVGEKITVQSGRTVCQFTAEEGWSFLSCFSGKCGGKKGGERLQKEPMAPEAAVLPSLPSNGKHSLLIVSKKNYQKMVQREERRKKDLKLIEDMKRLEEKNDYLSTKKNSSLNKSFDIAAAKEDKNNTKKLNTSQIQQQQQGKFHRRATVFFEETLRFHRGDTADDIDFSDCV